MLPGALNPRDLVMYVGCVALSGPVCARVNPPSGSWAGVPTFHQVGLATHRWARGVAGCCVESVDPYWCVHGTAVARVRGISVVALSNVRLTVQLATPRSIRILLLNLGRCIYKLCRQKLCDWE